MARTRKRPSSFDGLINDKRPNLRLREHARYAGMSDELLAEKLGWNLKKVQRILNGETRLLVNHLRIFSLLLNKPERDLLETDAPAAPTRSAA